MKANAQLPGVRRACVPLLLLSGAAAAATCLVEGPAIYVLPVLGAGLAVIVVRLCRRPPRGASDAAPPLLPRSARLSRSALKLTAFALLGVNAVLGLAALRVVSHCHGCRRIVEDNLRAVWTGLKLHHKHTGQYPESLGDLVLDSTCITLTLESPLDPEVGWVPTVRDVIYTSYMYRPGAGPWVTDPTLILAHDRAAFSRLRERLFQTPGRFVLFADGACRRAGTGGVLRSPRSRSCPSSHARLARRFARAAGASHAGARAGDAGTDSVCTRNAHNPGEHAMSDGSAHVQLSQSAVEHAMMRRLTWAIILLTLATLLSFIGLFAGNGGLIAAAAAPCVATAALFVRLTPAAARPAVAPRLWQYARRVAVGVRLAVVACILASVVVFLFQLGNARMRSLGAGSTYNLRAILTALDGYAAQRGAYPATLPELAECGLLYPKQLICGFDARSEDAVRREGYSSYVYLPGIAPDCRDPAVVLVYERLAWSYQNAWYGDRAYQAGFADGTVRKLSVHELAEALARDAFRRRELDVPLPGVQSQPAARPQAGSGD